VKTLKTLGVESKKSPKDESTLFLGFVFKTRLSFVIFFELVFYKKYRIYNSVFSLTKDMFMGL